MNRIIFLTTLILALAVGKTAKAVSDDCFKSIAKAIETGNHSDLAASFSTNVECDILGNNNMYSKPHASQIMRKFFLSNKPQKFEILHQGGKNPRFIIGAYKNTDGAVFRISCFVKYDEAQKEYLIYQIRVENEQIKN